LKLNEEPDDEIEQKLYKPTPEIQEYLEKLK